MAKVNGVAGDDHFADINNDGRTAHEMFGVGDGLTYKLVNN